MHSVVFSNPATVDIKCSKCGAALEVVGEDEEGDADVTILVAPHECEEKSAQVVLN